MGFCHKFGIKPYETLCMIQSFPAGLVDGIHNHLVKLCLVNARLAFDPAGSGITSCYGAVIKQKHLCVFLKTEGIAILNRHVCHDGSG